ncbi:type I restriction-modification system, M subunit [compost metagenome]
MLREQLIERDLVESVILLPAGMWNSMNIETCVLILNKSKQMKGIRMLDARGFGQRKAARLTLTTDDSAQIKCLMLGLKEDETISKLVSIQEVKEKNYSLHCAEYFTAAINIEEVDLQQELQILKDVQQQYYKAQERFNALVKTTTSTENT